ncbi:hypothetical protein K469DRAFT_726131 [Zopfia rhizophila CBS 207.26]|uniref:Uncharacterized protein n=1 Tax=Zopfia rhizophila CBS 207.26 TaxID=1314779 RepID=A0A6A6E480_9PEZI|nr:hypothetical protein K469DRAFT_726131 [Zopfia rhizophila CBS 207.26]
MLPIGRSAIEVTAWKAPCDVAVFAPLKAAYHEQVERLERGGVNTISKEHFTSLFSSARKRAFTLKNIKAGFAASGLFPFNPDRVLRDMPKPPAELTISKANEVKVGPCPQDAVLQTPVTLGVLQQDQIQFLMMINNKAKVRRSTKSVVLGTARVMSYKDLKEARAKRAEKEAAKETRGKAKCGRKCRKATAQAVEAAANKVKRGRKRKNATPELEAPEPKAKVARMSGKQAAEDEFAPEPWRAAVARMW